MINMIKQLSLLFILLSSSVALQAMELEEDQSNTTYPARSSNDGNNQKTSKPQSLSGSEIFFTPHSSPSTSYNFENEKKEVAVSSEDPYEFNYKGTTYQGIRIINNKIEIQDDIFTVSALPSNATKETEPYYEIVSNACEAIQDCDELEASENRVQLIVKTLDIIEKNKKLISEKVEQLNSGLSDKSSNSSSDQETDDLFFAPLSSTFPNDNNAYNNAKMDTQETLGSTKPSNLKGAIINHPIDAISNNTSIIDTSEATNLKNFSIDNDERFEKKKILENLSPTRLNLEKERNACIDQLQPYNNKNLSKEQSKAAEELKEKIFNLNQQIANSEITYKEIPFSSSSEGATDYSLSSYPRLWTNNIIKSGKNITESISKELTIKQENIFNQLAPTFLLNLLIPHIAIFAYERYKPSAPVLHKLYKSNLLLRGYPIMHNKIAVSPALFLIGCSAYGKWINNNHQFAFLHKYNLGQQIAKYGAGSIYNSFITQATALTYASYITPDNLTLPQHIVGNAIFDYLFRAFAMHRPLPAACALGSHLAIYLNVPGSQNSFAKVLDQQFKLSVLKELLPFQSNNIFLYDTNYSFPTLYPQLNQPSTQIKGKDLNEFFATTILAVALQLGFPYLCNKLAVRSSGIETSINYLSEKKNRCISYLPRWAQAAAHNWGGATAAFVMSNLLLGIKR